MEMPKFNKTEDELETNFDKWMYVLKNLCDLTDRPAALQERVFKKLFKIAEIAQFSPEEVREYEHSVKVYRDNVNVVNTATRKAREKALAEGHAEGIAEGHAEEKIGIAIKMAEKNMSIGVISEITELPIEELRQIIKNKSDIL
jgi:predicted transposase/invertase (TIGR01784 family)